MLSPEEFENLPDVSRETFENFQAWKRLLERWNARINLVSPSAMGDFWGRHALDSWQLWGLAPNSTETILDFGSGAGFPGLAMAIGCKQAGKGHVTLVESVGKKANFLKTVIRELSLPAEVWAGRAEDLAPKPYDLITARAFAPLPKLLNYAQPFWGEGTIALLLKGQSANEELTSAEKLWNFDVENSPSRSDDSGIILKISALSKRPQ